MSDQSVFSQVNRFTAQTFPVITENKPLADALGRMEIGHVEVESGILLGDVLEISQDLK